MIDPATDWIQIRTVPSARTDLVSNIVELVWLTRYPLPSKVIVDCGNHDSSQLQYYSKANYFKKPTS